MSKPKRTPIPRAVCAGGLIASLTGLLLTVASMEHAPITVGKLLLAGLCLALLYAFSLPLRYQPQRQQPVSSASLHIIRQHTDTPDRAA